MRAEPIHRIYGTPMSQWIAETPGELPIDSVGFRQVVTSGRYDFALEGAELVDFVRRCLWALVERGAVPVIGGGGTDYFWIHQPQYGSAKEGIVEAVIAEWLKAGGGDPEHGSLWFALPEACLIRKRR